MKSFALVAACVALCALVAADVEVMSARGPEGTGADDSIEDYKELSTAELKENIKKQAMAFSMCHLSLNHIKAHKDCQKKQQPAIVDNGDLGEGMEAQLAESQGAYLKAAAKELAHAVARGPATSAMNDGHTLVDGLTRAALVALAQKSELSQSICTKAVGEARKLCKNPDEFGGATAGYGDDAGYGK